MTAGASETDLGLAVPGAPPFQLVAQDVAVFARPSVEGVPALSASEAAFASAVAAVGVAAAVSEGAVVLAAAVAEAPFVDRDAVLDVSAVDQLVDEAAVGFYPESARELPPDEASAMSLAGDEAAAKAAAGDSAAALDDLAAADLGAVEPVVDGWLPQPAGGMTLNALAVAAAEPSAADLAATEPED